jgi:hypothetical protein
MGVLTEHSETFHLVWQESCAELCWQGLNLAERFVVPEEGLVSCLAACYLLVLSLQLRKATAFMFLSTC